MISASTRLHIHEKPLPLEHDTFVLTGDARTLFDNAPDALLILDPTSGRVLAANLRACELYGYSCNEFVARFWPDISNDANWKPRDLTRTPQVRTCRRRDRTTVQVEVGASLIELNGYQ